MEADLRSALDTLATLDEPIGLNWFRHARAAGAADDLLNVVIADGRFTTKIDGWIHAATMTTRSIANFAGNSAGPPQLDIAELTAWTGGNAAARYGRWQTDFHWKIDTRAWQYVLYLKFMRDAYRDGIDDCPDFSAGQRAALQRLVTEFYDQAEIALLYRWEFIERGRQFARHPDPTAGAATHGYTYQVDLPLPEIPFEELALDLSEGTRTRAAAREVPAFPRIDGARAETGIAALSKAWLECARKVGVADRWLRVRLGERMVPTRFNGWEAALEITLPSLARFAKGARACSIEPGAYVDLDLADYAVRFGLCQAEFQRRLRGGAVELITLLEAERDALAAQGAELPAVPAIRPIAIETFFGRAIAAIGTAFDRELPIEESWLPELAEMRPLHPRFAPHDPLEPLPWQPKNPESYDRKMKGLGYVI